MIRNKRYPRGGFTLIELLVVVLIIGILAAIALPQYQMSVGKARYSELKTITKNVWEAAQRYYLANNTYVGANNNIDIEIPKTISSCNIWPETSNDMIACYKYIFGKKMGYYIIRESMRPSHCLTFSIDTNDLSNRLCHEETKDRAHCVEGDGYCSYYY